MMSTNRKRASFGEDTITKGVKVPVKAKELMN